MHATVPPTPLPPPSLFLHGQPCYCCECGGVLVTASPLHPLPSLSLCGQPPVIVVSVVECMLQLSLPPPPLFSCVARPVIVMSVVECMLQFPPPRLPPPPPSLICGQPCHCCECGGVHPPPPPKPPHLPSSICGQPRVIVVSVVECKLQLSPPPPSPSSPLFHMWPAPCHCCECGGVHAPPTPLISPLPYVASPCHCECGGMHATASPLLLPPLSLCGQPPVIVSVVECMLQLSPLLISPVIVVGVVECMLQLSPPPLSFPAWPDLSLS